MSRVMDMACVALPCLLLPARQPPGEPGDMVWADSVASLFTAAACRAATLSTHVVNARKALHSRRRTLGRAIKPEQATTPAAGHRNCFFKPTGSTHR